MKNNKQVIVIGGGAAGMMAAISAKRMGADVTILERNPRVGKKILATGNGRCNFTNIDADITCYSGNNPKFAYSALASFSVTDTINFFEGLGINYKVEDLGKVFPMSDQASSILDVLLYELRELGVKIVCNAKVGEITQEHGRFIVRLEKGEENTGKEKNKREYATKENPTKENLGAEYFADSVIIATGGKAMPASGSDGNGYNLAVMLGHTVTDIYPALVQLMLEGPYFKRLNGIKFVGTAEVIHQNKSFTADRGDILFTNYGVSGPPILQISRVAGELLNEGKEASLKVMIMDSMPPEVLRKLIADRLQSAGGKPLDFSFVGLINKGLIPVILMEAGINDLSRPAARLSPKEQERIVDVLTDWRFKIRGTRSWPSAQVTAGGVDTKEIRQNTMESRLAEGLFFAGEIIDIDGKCGGFNLQWAWSSGFIAGHNAGL